MQLWSVANRESDGQSALPVEHRRCGLESAVAVERSWRRTTSHSSAFAKGSEASSDPGGVAALTSRVMCVMGGDDQGAHGPHGNGRAARHSLQESSEGAIRRTFVEENLLDAGSGFPRSSSSAWASPPPFSSSARGGRTTRCHSSTSAASASRERTRTGHLAGSERVPLQRILLYVFPVVCDAQTRLVRHREASVLPDILQFVGVPAGVNTRNRVARARADQ